MNLFIVFLIAVSLSMDAFSLSLAYGTLGMTGKEKLFLSIITGIFHFFMPLLGMAFGSIILDFINVNPNLIVTVILCFIGFDMILSSFKDKKVSVMRYHEYFLFAFAVSVDSFSVGITFTDNAKNVIISFLIFSVVSSVFTYIGLLLGNKIEKLVGKISTMIGGVILIVIGLSYIL